MVGDTAVKCRRQARWLTVVVLVAASGCGGCDERGARGPSPETDGAWHVRPGQEIQPVLDQAAADPTHKRVVVHAGTYRPQRPGQALVWFNARHDRVVLEAAGKVVLTAANPDLADRDDDSFPAVVNHVVYFGDGISRRTVLRGFTITGANRFQTRADAPGPIEPSRPELDPQNLLFFYCDGGGIKVFARSYPTIERVDVVGNVASPCGGGVSIQHLGFQHDEVTFRDCIFRDNGCQVTGSAIDVLPGSSARIENCLFVGNVANTGEDSVSPKDEPYNAEHGSGALTVFPGSKVTVVGCTFTDNWNGVDDKGQDNVYRDSIFWRNTRAGGISPKGRYELDILHGRQVVNCRLGGATDDLRGTVDADANVLGAPDPLFDREFRPRSPDYAGVGFRPPVAAGSDRPKQR